MFRDARTDSSPDFDYLSLHLAFYLASWGMYRGSCFIFHKDYKVHTTIVEAILKPEYDCLLGLACTDVRNNDIWAQLKKLSDYISDYFDPIRKEVRGRARLRLLCRRSSSRKCSWERSGACPRTTDSFRMALRHTR